MSDDIKEFFEPDALTPFKINFAKPYANQGYANQHVPASTVPVAANVPPATGVNVLYGQGTIGIATAGGTGGSGGVVVGQGQSQSWPGSILKELTQLQKLQQAQRRALLTFISGASVDAQEVLEIVLRIRFIDSCVNAELAETQEKEKAALAAAYGYKSIQVQKLTSAAQSAPGVPSVWSQKLMGVFANKLGLANAYNNKKQP
jgi:hypothetical protein